MPNFESGFLKPCCGPEQKCVVSCEDFANGLAVKANIGAVYTRAQVNSLIEHLRAQVSYLTTQNIRMLSGTGEFPPPTPGNKGVLYQDEDTDALFVSTGTEWTLFAMDPPFTPFVFVEQESPLTAPPTPVEEDLLPGQYYVWVRADTKDLYSYDFDLEGWLGDKEYSVNSQVSSTIPNTGNTVLASSVPTWSITNKIVLTSLKISGQVAAPHHNVGSYFNLVIRIAREGSGVNQQPDYVVNTQEWGDTWTALSERSDRLLWENPLRIAQISLRAEPVGSPVQISNSSVGMSYRKFLYPEEELNLE